MRDFREAKAMAQTLRDSLKAKSISLTHSESLELIAKSFGFHDWNVLAARIEASQAVDDEPTEAARAVASNSARAVIPIVPLRDIVLFPQMVTPLFVGRDKTKRAVNSALGGDGVILAITQRRSGDDDPRLGDLYPVGVTASVVKVIPLSDGTFKLIVAGLQRVTIVRPIEGDYLSAEVAVVEDVRGEPTPETLALTREVLDAYQAFARTPPSRSHSHPVEPGMLADSIAVLLQVLSVRIDKMAHLLETADVVRRLEMLRDLMRVSQQAA
ncbi:MAG TPA: LON peptidase substrate-binding domain-containing protein [Bradyrhizobium sp.]|uniref:LON peptidase substrate-binding domain-containing protein n=1 Tax=Bradyrhizobium sp. TaxID=376 RepID=UPI002C8C2FED|nr:LON peptidase substrate-binding domain-containing protein [Bradyrhizobium sp.]HLZ00848.1 LON peptidase substrate-binding domain-containing protein [Bradyrhizobium sp.]